MTQQDVRAALAAKLTGDEFSCVAAKTAWLKSTVVHRHFGPLAAVATTPRLHMELADFARRRDDIDPLLATFVATFASGGGSGAQTLDEVAFEKLTWHQLQQLHDLDALSYPWDPAADSDPASDRFGFSIAGQAFFVVGLYPGASRISRRFDHPALVFNAHVQFERLKERGIYQRIKQQVRQREMALQGSLNPNLTDFGTTSEAPQYSGRAVEADWQCPFQPRVPTSAAQPGGAR